jgi:magnesium chelatase accessory protein
MSRFVEAGGMRWHVQMRRAEGGGKLNAPVALFVHGTGASTHSWRGALSQFSQAFTLVAPDLPGHGFTASPPNHRYTLPSMADGLFHLMEKLAVRPTLVIGHSAGAAILARMCLDHQIAPRHLISLNGAMLPLSGLAGAVFSPLARLLSGSQLIPRLFAWRARDPDMRERMLNATGSKLDPEGAALYGTLMQNAAHASAALDMMAQWDLRPLQRDLPEFASLPCQMTLAVGENDLTVPPRESERVREILPTAKLVSLGPLGHLAHEERPAEVCALIERLAA